MKCLLPSCGALLVCLLLIATAQSDEKAKPGGAQPAAAQFEQLKRLAGDWTGKASHGAGEHEATVTYKVTSAGNAVMETLFCFTDHEMVTMYHLDGDAIVLTHYCAAGNQPRMKAEPGGDPKRLVFRFLDGTNLDPAKDFHMHDATIELVDDDHIRSAWTSYVNGKADSVAKFDLRRKK
jgi:hypothetical protein